MTGPNPPGELIHVHESVLIFFSTDVILVLESMRNHIISIVGCHTGLDLEICSGELPRDM